MIQNSGSWKPIVSNLTGAGTVKIERAKWLQDYEGIIHFEVFFTYAPPRSVDVESVDFVLTFPTEFHHKGSLYGWFDCGKGVLLALNPDVPNGRDYFRRGKC